MSLRLRCIGVLVAALVAGPAAAEQVLINVDATAFSQKSIVFEPGAFRVGRLGKNVTAMCALVRGAWRRIRPGASLCPIVQITGRPPENLLIAHAPRMYDSPRWVIANLGLTSDQWALATAIREDPSVPRDNVLKMISQGTRVERLGAETRWSFDSGQLPLALRAEIPGSGIYYHVEYYLSQSRVPFLFDSETNDLLVETELGLPVARVNGGATSTVTVGLILQTVGLDGKLSPLPLLVSVFHSRGDAREFVSMDGHGVTYAASPLSEAATFIAPVYGHVRSTAWSGNRPFAFRVNRASISKLIEATNAVRIRYGYSPLESDLSKVRLKGIDIRNENRFLDKGRAYVTLDVGILRAVKESE